MVGPAKSYGDLVVWRKAHEFVLGVYALTAEFPKYETYGLAQQMRRAPFPSRPISRRGFDEGGGPIRPAS